MTSQNPDDSVSGKDIISGIEALVRVGGILVVAVFAFMFLREIYQSNALTALERSNSHFQAGQYDPKICEKYPTPFLGDVRSSSRFGLWIDSLDTRSTAYSYAQEALSAESASGSMTRGGDAAGARQASLDAHSRWDLAVNYYLASRCVEAEMKRRSY